MKKPLFCIPYAGGSVSVLNELASEFDGTTIKTIELPGKGIRANETPCESFGMAVKDCMKQFVSFPNYSMSTVFGYSMGGLLAFETVKRIFINYAKLPENLVIAACDPPPSFPKKEKISDYEESKFCDYLLNTGGITKEVIENEDSREYFLPIIRNDFRVLESYRETPFYPLPMKLTIFFSTDEDNVEEWERYTKYGCKYYKFDGGHFFIHKQYKTMAKIIKSLMDDI